MAKKKKNATQKQKQFSSSPFSNLKGFAVSGEGQAKEMPSEQSPPSTDEGSGASFAEQMALLGVERLDAAESDVAEVCSPEDVRQTAVESEGQEFMRAMEELQVDFRDQFPEEDRSPVASAGRMKQLRRGKLVPDASLDLHGLQRSEVAAKVRFFLQDAVHQGWRTLLLITGRGLHSSDGEPVLRNEAERFLADEGRKWLVEWGRAPKQYGGEGALVLFLRNKS